MTLTKGKHIVKEIDGTRCTVVDTGITKERLQFLTNLLEHNGFEIKEEKEEGKEEENQEPTYIIGVTDLTFNPIIAVYQRKLLTIDGRKVTPAYWDQRSEETDPNYWDLGVRGEG